MKSDHTIISTQQNYVERNVHRAFDKYGRYPNKSMIPCIATPSPTYLISHYSSAECHILNRSFADATMLKVMSIMFVLHLEISQCCYDTSGSTAYVPVFDFPSIDHQNREEGTFMIPEYSFLLPCSKIKKQSASSNVRLDQSRTDGNVGRINNDAFAYLDQDFKVVICKQLKLWQSTCRVEEAGKLENCSLLWKCPVCVRNG